MLDENTFLNNLQCGEAPSEGTAFKQFHSHISSVFYSSEKI